MMKTSASLRVLFAALLAVFVALASRSARADFTPPPFTSSVVDDTGTLTENEHSTLVDKIAQRRRAAGYPVVVYVAKSLQGESIEDVGYKTARTWAIGDAGKDNGVLLVIAPSERRLRIEAGKGVGGALTDLESNTILHEQVGPLLKRNQLKDAIAAGIDGIYAALATEPLPSGSKAQGHPKGAASSVPFIVFLLPILFFGFIMVVLARVLRGGGGRSRGYGYRNDDDRYGGGPPIIFGGGGGWGGDGGGGGGDSGGSNNFGGDSPSDYSGGGDFGGGGSSDSY